MASPKDLAHIHLSLEKVNMRAGHKVLMEADKNILLIICDSQGVVTSSSGPTQMTNLKILLICQLMT